MKLQLKKKAPAPKAKAPVKKLHLTKKAAPAPAPAPVKKGGLRLLSHPTTTPAKDPYGWASTPHSSLMPTGKEPLLGPGGERINGALPPPDPKTVLRADQMQMDMLCYKGKPVLRNPVAPTGKIALLNTEHMKVKYLPHVPTRAEIEFFDKIGLQGSSGGNAPIQATSIPVRLVEIAKTGDSHKISMRVTLAMAVTRRNACAIVQDIQE